VATMPAAERVTGILTYCQLLPTLMCDGVRLLCPTRRPRRSAMRPTSSRSALTDAPRALDDTCKVVMLPSALTALDAADIQATALSTSEATSSLSGRPLRRHYRSAITECLSAPTSIAGDCTGYSAEIREAGRRSETVRPQELEDLPDAAGLE